MYGDDFARTMPNDRQHVISVSIPGTWPFRE